MRLLASLAKGRLAMITHRKVGGLHFVTCGRMGFSFHVKRRAAPRVARLTAPMVAAAFVGAITLAMLIALPSALDAAAKAGKSARWMLTHRDARNVYIDDYNLTFDDCEGMRANGQRCRIQPKGLAQWP